MILRDTKREKELLEATTNFESTREKELEKRKFDALELKYLAFGIEPPKKKRKKNKKKKNKEKEDEEVVEQPKSTLSDTLKSLGLSL